MRFRNLTLEEGCFVLGRLCETVEHSRFNRPRAHDVDTNTGAGEFDRRRLRDAFDRMFAAHINRRARTADLAISRGDIDDAALALRKHSPNLVLHTQQNAKHIGVEDRSVVLDSYIGGRTNNTFCAGVVDCDIETAETSDGLVDQILDVILMTNIGTTNSASAPVARSSRTSSAPSSSLRPETTTRAPSFA